MGSKYPRSVRGCLPLFALALETALILSFFFFTSYTGSLPDQKELLEAYRGFQDVTVMAALGLGFLNSSLRRHGWSSVAFTLFLLALGVQWAILVEGFLSHFFRENVVLTLSSLRIATMSAMSTLISAGAVLGKVNLVQLMLMALMEVTAFGTLRMVNRLVLVMDNHISMMHIHVFAAYFGLAVAWCLSRRLPKVAEEKDQTATSPSLFAMLGTLFLWMFWPSFNSTLLYVPSERKNAVFSTYYALAVSTVTAIAVSAWSHPEGKISMIHIHKAVLAGGVAVGIPGPLILSPWIAMVLGLLAGLFSVGGAKYLPVCLNRVLGIHDTGSVHSTFGLPGLLGGITYLMLMMHWVNWTKNSMLSYQLLINTGALSLAVAMGLVSGLLTGCLLALKIWRAPHAAKYFDDQAFWKFPHLTVGY
ncbi:blood group Rh(CE) polypeptide isoform X1 [Tenrec ecaudatus]|uniref:blood group Rh(CE) polypeptide isoform X1 n=1 Tax=Tenrec ecaudatus TaxID=94439 RepID=UPI003F5AAA73